MDVLCIGHASWDINLYLDGYPAENSKCEIREMLECGGGPAANAACLLSRWGIPCGIAASIGDDSYGDRIADEFVERGVDATALHRSPHNATPVSVILVNCQNASRTIVNRKTTLADIPLQLSRESPTGGSPRVLLFDGHELQSSLEAMERFPDAQSILDAGSLRDGTRELAKRVDYLVASERFAKQLSGMSDLRTPENQAQAVDSLYACNGNPVIITRGEQGVLYGLPGQIRQFPAFPARAVDTTAAGDIFHGAFAYGVLRGFPLEQTIRLASAAAAISVTVQGGRTSIPSLQQTQELLHRAQ